MTRILAALTMAITIGAGTHAQKTAGDAALEIRAMEDQWNEARARADVATLERILVDDWTVTHSNGTTDTKATYLADLRSGARTFAGAVSVTDFSVRLYGDTAVAAGSSKSTVTLNGQPQGGALHFTRVYVRRNGAWKMIVSHATTRRDPAAPAAASCESLASLALPNTTITQAHVVEAGAFMPPAPAGAPAPAPAAGQTFRNLPAFCRVAATLEPSSDSDIKVEVWLPVSGWNGKFEGVGNGGWAGVISYPALAGAVRRGYAAASTDTGHAGSGGDASFAYGHPEKLTDFAYRAVHEMTVQAKAVVNAYYGNAPRLSYWNGCSTGGRQGLKEAQKYPADYDGILAGAPANYMTHLSTQILWVAHATLKDPASYIPREKFAVIHKGVLDACDALDGVKDGVIEDPTRCRFDPKALQCGGEDTSACLTAPQVEAARKIYGPAKNPKTGAEIFPGLEPGSELGWAALAGGPKPFSIANDHFRYIVFKNPSWDFKTLDFDKDVALADRLDNGLANATDPNLKPFFDRGGRILMYHGWNDQLIAPRNSINYYKSVAGALGGVDKVAGSFRLFMVPGMNHCAGGDGTSSFDGLAALEQWVEQKTAPGQMIGTHLTGGVADRTRPLCPYPQVAEYKGAGSTDEASSFVCK